MNEMTEYHGSTVFENHRKKSHFATLQQNFIKNPFGQFDGQTVLPDRSILKGQKFVENAKIKMRQFGWFWNKQK